MPIPPLEAVMVLPSGRLQLKPFSLQPDCRAEERIFWWRGTNSPQPYTINVSIIQLLADLASQALLWDASGYGLGL
jgi:hypothetical protein